jgi:hypothetical protein
MMLDFIRLIFIYFLNCYSLSVIQSVCQKLYSTVFLTLIVSVVF